MCLGLFYVKNNKRVLFFKIVYFCPYFKAYLTVQDHYCA